MGVPFNYHHRLTSMVILTLLMIAFPWVRDFMKHLYRERRRAARIAASTSRLNRRWSTQFHESIGHRLRDLCLIILLIHPTLSGYALNFFNCKFIEERGGEHLLNNKSGTYYMVADYSLQCYDSAYNGMMILAIVIIVLMAMVFCCGYHQHHLQGHRNRCHRHRRHGCC